MKENELKNVQPDGTTDVFRIHISRITIEIPGRHWQLS